MHDWKRTLRKKMPIGMLAVAAWLTLTIGASYGNDVAPIPDSPIGQKEVSPRGGVRADRPECAVAAAGMLGAWPCQTAGEISSVVLADLNGDDQLEVIANSLFDGIYVWNHEGQPVEGWPFLSTFVAKASPAVGDVDGDGSFEIAVSANFRFFLLNADGTLYPGWGQFISGGWPGSPALFDLDGDGDLEILAAYNAYGSTPAALYVWHHNGALAAGWPRFVSEPVKGSPAVADLDGDGEPEIVLAGNFDHNVYVWRVNGELFPGWPQHDNERSDAYCSASIGDLDNDGDMEIVSAGGTMVFVRHHDGIIAQGWPRQTYSTIDGSPALADVDRDGDLEIFVGSSLGGLAYAWHHDGSFVEGWPTNVSGPGQIMIDGSVAPTPAIADINSDGELDVVIAGGNNHNVYAYSWNGVEHSDGWPKLIEEDYQYIASPALGDVDGDGDIEVAIGTRGGAVYLWDEAGAFNEENVAWPMFRHDLHQTGWYEWPRPGDLDGDGRVDLDDFVKMWSCMAGPGVNVLPDGCSGQQFDSADLDGDDDVDIGDHATFQFLFAPGPQ